MVSTDFGRYARCKQKLAELRFKKQLARDAAAQPCRGRLGISTALFDAISKFKPFIYCMKIYEISFFDAGGKGQNLASEYVKLLVRLCSCSLEPQCGFRTLCC